MKLKLNEEIIAHHREHVKVCESRIYTTCTKNGYELGGVTVSLLWRFVNLKSISNMKRLICLHVSGTRWLSGCHNSKSQLQK